MANDPPKTAFNPNAAMSFLRCGAMGAMPRAASPSARSLKGALAPTVSVAVYGEAVTPLKAPKPPSPVPKSAICGATITRVSSKVAQPRCSSQASSPDGRVNGCDPAFR